MGKFNRMSLWDRLVPFAALFLAMGCSSAGAPSQEPAPQASPAELATPITPTPIQFAQAGEFDNGKMWTFEYPPLDYFARTYGFTPDASWFEKARLGSLRIQGCSASFVSPNGLVLTNHHCARESVTEVSEPGENLLDNGFYATSLEAERTSSQTADQLIEIVDVTEEVMSAIAAAGEAEAAQEEIAARLAAERGGEEAGIHVEVIALWNGAKYSAYVFHRYTDVRLVLAPELQIGFFGGDPDNFTYPRYNLDFSLFRLYGDDDRPLSTDTYFPFDD
ncbi:MAG TPA: S46 family peptidase, partial [Gemmatimonadota bacterium]|nr:S46 family peptidase [Gemmatimonadota bacterium]